MILSYRWLDAAVFSPFWAKKIKKTPLVSGVFKFFNNNLFDNFVADEVCIWVIRTKPCCRCTATGPVFVIPHPDLVSCLAVVFVAKTRFPFIAAR